MKRLTTRIEKRCPKGYHIDHESGLCLDESGMTPQTRERQDNASRSKNPDKDVPKRTRGYGSKDEQGKYDTNEKGSELLAEAVPKDSQAYRDVVTAFGKGEENEKARQGIVDFMESNGDVVPRIVAKPFVMVYADGGYRLGEKGEQGYAFDGHTSTQDAYKVDGKYTKERQELHAKIISRIIEGYTDENGKVHKGFSKPEGREPCIVFMGGGSGAGKSSLTARMNEDGLDFPSIDPDAIMVDHIPEYRALSEQNTLTSAFLAHDEASDITMMMFKICIENGYDFIMDGTLSNPDKLRKFQKMIDDSGHGYRKVLRGVTIDVDEAKASCKGRYVATSRFVPMDVVEKSNAGFSKVAHDDTLMDWFDGIKVYNRTGDTVTEVMERKDGKTEVKDKERWNMKKNKRSIKSSDNQPTYTPISMEGAFIVYRVSGDESAFGGRDYYISLDSEGNTPHPGDVGNEDFEIELANARSVSKSKKRSTKSTIKKQWDDVTQWIVITGNSTGEESRDTFQTQEDAMEFVRQKEREGYSRDGGSWIPKDDWSSATMILGDYRDDPTDWDAVSNHDGIILDDDNWGDDGMKKEKRSTKSGIQKDSSEVARCEIYKEIDKEIQQIALDMYGLDYIQRLERLKSQWESILGGPSITRDIETIQGKLNDIKVDLANLRWDVEEYKEWDDGTSKSRKSKVAKYDQEIYDNARSNLNRSSIIISDLNIEIGDKLSEVNGILMDVQDAIKYEASISSGMEGVAEYINNCAELCNSLYLQANKCDKTFTDMMIYTSSIIKSRKSKVAKYSINGNYVNPGHERETIGAYVLGNAEGLREYWGDEYSDDNMDALGERAVSEIMRELDYHMNQGDELEYPEFGITFYPEIEDDDDEMYKSRKSKAIYDPQQLFKACWDYQEANGRNGLEESEIWKMSGGADVGPMLSGFMKRGMIARIKSAEGCIYRFNGQNMRRL